MDHQNEIQHPWLALMGPIIGAFVGMLSETSLLHFRNCRKVLTSAMRPFSGSLQVICL